MLHLEGIGGAVVHLGERLTGSQKVEGSNPSGSTKYSAGKKDLPAFFTGIVSELVNVHPEAIYI